MPVASVRPYPVDIKDSADRFHGAQLLYVGWDRHLMFYAPVALALPPDLPFADLASKVLAQCWGQHPDFARIDWSRVRWLKSGQPFTPDLAATLAGNGLRHKDVLRLQTPGLEGLAGAGF